jgi:hypothetical protein
MTLDIISNTFKEYFAPFGNIELPNPIPPKGNINQGRTGWQITYVLNEDDHHLVCLDFLASHPEAGMTHVRIDSDGKYSYLDTYRESYTFDPNIEGDKGRAEKEFLEYNRKIGAELKARGF